MFNKTCEAKSIKRYRYPIDNFHIMKPLPRIAVKKFLTLDFQLVCIYVFPSKPSLLSLQILCCLLATYRHELFALIKTEAARGQNQLCMDGYKAISSLRQQAGRQLSNLVFQTKKCQV